MVKRIHYSGEIEIEIPEESINMMLDDFKQSIDSSATEDSLFYHIAHNVIFCGCDEFTGVEGIGKDFNIISFEKPELDEMDY